MKGSDVVFDCVHLLHLKCHKINSKCGRFFVYLPIGSKIKKQQEISSIIMVPNTFNMLQHLH